MGNARDTETAAETAPERVVTPATDSSVSVLGCPQCGGPLPLADGHTITCPHCRAAAPIPDPYQELWRAGEPARRARRMAEAEYRRWLARTLPGWTVKLYSWTVIPLAVVGVPVLFGMTQTSVGWGPRHWVVLAGLAPLVVTLVPALILWARSVPRVYLEAIGGKLRPGPRNAWAGTTCGLCGAPLTVEPEALGATCSYCQADSWLSGSEAIRAEEANEQRHDRNLADLLRGQAFQSFDIRLALIIYPAVGVPILLLLYFLLPTGWD